MEFVIRFFCQSDEESRHLDNAEKELEGAGIKFYVGHYEGCREWFFDKKVVGNIEIISLDDYEPPDLKPYDEVYPHSS
jgi:hypothetical protein